MIRKFVLISILFCANQLCSQELNCNVIVNSELVNQTNQQVFKTLEKSLNDFVNKTKWTNLNVKENERINCSMLIMISSFENNNFQASIQVQSSRPVYNTNYETSVFNFQDKSFNFKYLEFEPLYFNTNVFDSNLTAVISYYVYLILGIDADTFELKGGNPYYNQAQNIVSLAQGTGYAGWQQDSPNARTRWTLIDNLKSGTYENYRKALYQYHRQGLDRMLSDEREAKTAIEESVVLLEQLNKVRSNSLMLQLFFDAKADEIADIFSGGIKTDIVSLVNQLNNLAPTYSASWKNIKY
ncbi:type IX secretion system protein PorD [Zhouia amylolytica]|uniref:DUF4835 domain-containing protein n=1 Tax=Zhouia amylolytica AD3 TaxID=1286632 RepID=W2UNW8_9FLAO|nr:DUF4835 family protein [Zhouia amylolytica]ETN95644.1 hypothetical protein P278_13660 [Zhouia amylolytica AD3]